MDGFHIKRIPEDKRNAFTGAGGGQPIPGEETFDVDDEIGPVRHDGFEKRLGASWHVLVQQNLAILVQDVEVHSAGMQIDAAVKLMLLGVESHEVSSSSLVFSLLP